MRKRERIARFIETAHDMCKGYFYIPCGSYIGHKHHPIEKRLAQELERVYSIGVNKYAKPSTDRRLLKATVMKVVSVQREARDAKKRMWEIGKEADALQARLDEATRLLQLLWHANSCRCSFCEGKDAFFRNA